MAKNQRRDSEDEEATDALEQTNAHAAEAAADDASGKVVMTYDLEPLVARIANLELELAKLKGSVRHMV